MSTTYKALIQTETFTRASVLFPYHSANGSASTPSTWEDSVLGFQPGWSEPCAEQSPGALLETANFGAGSLPSCWVLGMAKGALGMAKGAYSALISFFAYDGFTPVSSSAPLCTPLPLLNRTAGENRTEKKKKKGDWDKCREIVHQLPSRTMQAQCKED